MTTPINKEQIAQWHDLFQSLVDLTTGAENMAEVAQRYLNNACLHDAGTDPFLEAANLQNPATAFAEFLAEQFFDPRLHGDWAEAEQNELGAPKGGH